MTDRTPEQRVREIFQTVVPCGKLPYEILYKGEAVNDKGRVFRDSDVHYMLCAMGIRRGYGEWFECSVEDVELAVENVRHGMDANKLVEVNYKDQLGGLS